VGGQSRSRTLSVEVRVGDYARDNSNFFAPNFVTGGVARPMITGGLSVPIDDNYDEIRRQLWLGTDSAYKNALDLYAKKKAALENRRRTDDAPDFSKEPVVTDTQTSPPIAWNRSAFENTVKTLSALFREAAGIADSEVRQSANNWLTHYVNSEGSSYTRQISFATVQVNASTQATDGMTLTDFDVMYGRTMDELPQPAEMARRVRGLATRLNSLRQAALVERYTGPVLFEGQAAGELFFQGIASALVGVPRVVVDDLRFESAYNSDGGLAGKIGARILPDFLSITDNPATREFQGKPLYSGYQVDDEGVKAGPTVLVEKGVLKTLLHTRALIAGTTQSTASRRGPFPSPSNLIIAADKAMKEDQLKAELIRLVKQRGKEYGIVVRRMGNQSLAASLNRSVIIIFSGGNAPGSISVEPLIEAYKVFPDGHEELARNVTINGLTLGSFKDIVAVSDTPYIYAAPVRNTVRMPMMGTSFSSFGGPPVVSAVVPSLLFDEMTLERPKGDIPNLPVTKHPFFDK
jgi:predicted Zn-dependent protease